MYQNTLFFLIFSKVHITRYTRRIIIKISKNTIIKLCLFDEIYLFKRIYFTCFQSLCSCNESSKCLFCIYSSNLFELPVTIAQFLVQTTLLLKITFIIFYIIQNAVSVCCII